MNTQEQTGGRITTRFLEEHVRLIGFPQIIVTRIFAYTWLAQRGWSKRERGFGSLEYAAFGHASIDAPLTDPQHRDALLAQVEEGYQR